MKLLLSGTAAAEGWPSPWCGCPSCEAARKLGGKNIRGRSGLLLDDDLKIDYGPDTTHQMQRSGRSLARVRTIVFTHEHSDHLCPGEIKWMVPPYSQTPPESPVAIYGNARVISRLQAQLNGAVAEYLEWHTLFPLQPVRLNNGDELLPLPADHCPGALLLHLTRRGRSIFIGHDSGLYPEATLDALGGMPPLDVAFMDCTYGNQTQLNRGHMSIEGVVQMTQELRRRGAVAADTRVIATHFSHNGGMLHDELVSYFRPHGIEVAYDDMLIELAG